MGLHTLNQRYVALTDRCRSQWTFYQLLQGVFKHLTQVPCPVEVDYQELFSRLRTAAEALASTETDATAHTLEELSDELDRASRTLRRADEQVPPSMLRRFFDRLRRQDEKVLLAVIKFYLESGEISGDVLDKLDILFTRLAEIPRENGGTLVRERHEIERLVAPLVQTPSDGAPAEATITHVCSELELLKSEAVQATTFMELAGGGTLERLRQLKRSLGGAYLHPRILPCTLETTVAIKNRFQELWEDEEQQIMSDTNRVMEARRALDDHPGMVTSDLRELFEMLDVTQRKVEQGRQEDRVRREDLIGLRRTLKLILEQFDATHGLKGPSPTPASEPSAVFELDDADEVPDQVQEWAPATTQLSAPAGAIEDPLLREYLSKILFAFELVGPERPAAEIANAKEVAALRLESWEVEAVKDLQAGRIEEQTIEGQRKRLIVHSTALRIRLDEEAREIGRLSKRGSDRVAELLDRATHSLQRAAETERRFQWFIDDALYRGATDSLEALFRSRMRLLRAYSGLWLIHNDCGGISPF